MNVVITGASAGIGRAMAKTFVRKGHEVLAVARRDERLQTLRREMEQENGGVIHVLALDLTAQGAPRTLYEEAMRVFGKVHVLINNAGMSPYQAFSELHYDHLRQTLSLNVQALTELCHIFMPHMLAHGEPSHVVNVGSAGGYAPLPNFAVYSASKHYLRILTNILHYEYRGTNIRVSALHPGGILTEFAELAGQDINKFARMTMMTPEKMAEVVYPAILKGKRVIVPGSLYKLVVLIGKLFPFSWSMRITTLVYNLIMNKTPPTYSLHTSSENDEETLQGDQN